MGAGFETAFGRGFSFSRNIYCHQQSKKCKHPRKIFLDRSFALC